MIGALATLLIFQLVGEVAVQLSGLPIPGPVVGMVLLLVALRWRESLPDTLCATAETLLSHLSLLFVPAGVGIVEHGARLTAGWLAFRTRSPAAPSPPVPGRDA